MWDKFSFLPQYFVVLGRDLVVGGEVMIDETKWTGSLGTMKSPSLIAFAENIYFKLICALLVGIVGAVATLPFYSPVAYASSPQTFYAHTENEGYEANDNEMDQRTPEPNTQTYTFTPSGTGDFQIPGNNSSGGRYFTAGWPSPGTISSDPWTFHTWIQLPEGTATYYVKVFKNAEAAAQFTSSSVSIPTSWAETDTTGSAPAIDMSAGDRLRFEYWANISALPTQQRLPTGDGDVSGTWTVTPSSPTTRYDKVDDPIGSPDDNTTYIVGTVVGRSLFTYSAFSVPSNATITNLTLTYRHRDQVSTGTNNIRSSLKVNGTYYTTDPGINANNSLTVWAYRSYAWTTNPDTGAAWTVADINGTGSNPLQQWGVYTSDATPDVAVTQVYATVNYRVPVSIRIDDNSSPDTSTRVDTTVSQLIPTLGYSLLFLAIALFVGMLVKKGVLRPRMA